jgi:putative oxidoreductase
MPPYNTTPSKTVKYKNADLGLLIIRLGIGALFILHGFPKISGGPPMWEKLGGAMDSLGIHFLPIFWGFMAAIAEFGGGILLILGILWKPACILLIITMLVAIVKTSGNGLHGYSEALEMLIVFLGLFFTGPGKYKPGR